MVRHLVWHAAEQEALRTGHALVADDDEVGALLLGHVEDRVGRVALAGEGLDLHARLLDLVGRVAERGLHVLTRIDRPLKVVRSVLALGAQPALRDGLVRAHHAQLGRHALGQFRGLAYGLLRRVGAVRTHHD